MATLEGKVIAITAQATGAASGIGLAIAKLVASRGGAVAMSDVNQRALEEAAKAITSAGAKAMATVVDVSKHEQVTEWIQNVVKVMGRLDGAANFAGIGLYEQPVREYSQENWEKIMGVNCTGVFNCMRDELAVMEKPGSIVNAASVAGLKGFPGNVAYSASKHAVIGMTKTAAMEEAVRGVRVNAIAPGVINTPILGSKDFHVDMTTPMKRMGSPEEVAQLVVFLLSEESSYMTGSVYTIDGGMTS